jgi:hypothetical protein
VFTARPMPELIMLLSIPWWWCTVIGANARTKGSEGFPIALATLWGFFILLAGGLLWSLRSDIPTPPKDAPEIHAPQIAKCDDCGAPVRFADGEVSSTCHYCGGETYRFALVRGAHKRADKAARTLVAYVDKVKDSFATLFGAFAFFVVLPALLILLFRALDSVPLFRHILELLN